MGRRPLAALAGLSAVAAVLVVAPAHAPVARADVNGTGGDFVPFATPGRLLDTRNGTGGITGKLTGGSTHAFPVLGKAGVPALGVRAVLLNVVSVAPTLRTDLDLWPDGAPRPNTSTQNVNAGETLSNTAVVAPGSDGKIAIFNAAGSTDAVVDVEGYFTAVSGGAGEGGFVPVAQTRLVDTRKGIGAPKAAVPAHGSLTVTLAAGPVPATANAVFVGVTVPGVPTNGAGYLSAFPAGGTDGLPVKNFMPGDTAAGASLKLGQNGAVTFVNHSGAPVNFLVDVQGYFAASGTEGAGLNPLTTRLLDTRASTPIPANGTIDLQVGGTNGLPTAGIAGAVLNLTPFDEQAGGFVRAWPVDDPEPSTSLANFTANHIRSHNAVIRPGTEGKIRIRNASSGTINLVVDLEGWFAGKQVQLPVRQNVPVAAMQASPLSTGGLGEIHYAWVNNAGVLQEGHGDPDAFGFVEWTPISGTEAFTGPAGLAEHHHVDSQQSPPVDEKLVQVVAHNIDGTVWADTETSNDPPTFGTWVHEGGSMTSAPVVVTQPDTTLVVFAVDADGRLWDLAETGLSGPYGSWRSLGLADLVGTPTAVVDGSMVKVFGLDSTGAVEMASYASGALSPWTSLGGTGLTGTPAVVVLPGGRLRVFVRAADGSIQTKTQDQTGVFPPAWETLPGFVAAGSPSALLSPITSETEVVALGPDGFVYSNGETAAGSGAWRGWVQVPGTDGSVSDPFTFTFTNSSGAGWAFTEAQQLGAPKVSAVSQSTGLVEQDSPPPPTFDTVVLPAPPS